MGETRARLFCKVGELAGASFGIDDEITIGRNPDCSAVIEPVQMSSRHARIFFDAEQGRFCLEDLDSLNGTELDGEAVQGVEPLSHLNVITFAHRFDFIFQDLERCARRHQGVAAPSHPSPMSSDDVERTRIEALPSPMPGILERLAGMVDMDQDISKFETLEAKGEKTSYQKIIPRLPSNLMDADPDEASVDGFSAFEPTEEHPPGLWLRVFLGEGEEQAFPLSEGEHLVGRESKADIRPASQEISRRHARFVVRGEVVTVEDLGSRNHTFLDDQQVEGVVEVPLGTEVRFGRVVAQVVHTGRPAEDA